MGKSKIIKILKNPEYVYFYMKSKGTFRNISDEKYIKLLFKYRMGYTLDLENPQTFNEKLQWLKLNDRRPLYTQLVDKYKVREFIASKIGEEYLVPLYGVWNSYDEIDFDSLPDQFVLKPNHTSGNVFICKDKKSIDYSKLKELVTGWMKREYFWRSREWPYKDIKPKIIAEEYLVDNEVNELRDYKFFCFNGEVKMMYVATERGIDTKFNFFDVNFNHIPVKQSYENSSKHIEKPKKFDEMLELATAVSKGFPHIRVDFYEENNNIHFGELTFYHQSGMEKFDPEYYDQLFGSWLNLPNK